MRRLMVVLVPLALLPAHAPAYGSQASEAMVVAHGWGYTLEDKNDIYSSRGFCDGVAVGLAVSTTVSCYFTNAVGPAQNSVSVTTSTPVAAIATSDALTEWRGHWCWQAAARFVDGSVAYYPGPDASAYECAPL